MTHPSVIHDITEGSPCCDCLEAVLHLVGILVGMTFVVPRRGGRYEIRESIYSKDGPRARSLSNFAILTEEVLAKAARRSSCPFDREGVITSARRAGAPIHELVRASAGTWPPAPQAGEFVRAARRFAAHAGDGRPSRAEDPGASLEQLLRFAEEVRRHSPRRRHEPLAFPVLSRASGSADAS